MAIVKMKRLQLIALAKDRDALLSELLHVGCVEVREPEEEALAGDGNASRAPASAAKSAVAGTVPSSRLALAVPFTSRGTSHREPEEEALAGDGNAALLHRDASALAEARSDLTGLQHAIEVLGKYAPQKKGLFNPRARMGEAELLDGAARRAALDKAEAINGHARAIGQLNARETRVNADRLALEPWSGCDVPLEVKGTAKASLLLGTVPATAGMAEMACTSALRSLDISSSSRSRAWMFSRAVPERSLSWAKLKP